MKLLNLSSLTVATDRRLKIGEETHVINPLKVIDFIRITEIAQQIDEEAKKGTPTVLREVELIMDLVTATIPTVQRETLNNLGIAELQSIASFIKGMDVPGTIETEEAVEAEAGEGK